MADAETKSFTGGLYGVAMDRRIAEWKLGIERIWSAAAPDYQEAACLADDIARFSEHTMLRQAATQALPILRSAVVGTADRSIQDAARRRLGIVREALHTLTTPQFGRRQGSMKSLTAEERYRQMLGLPLDRRLSVPEIHRAWKHVAKRVHPDAGGSAREFLELSAARDALMKKR